ncbi:MAG: hypothetical protein AB1489_42985 [Acidobacteriota bacterium]
MVTKKYRHYSPQVAQFWDDTFTAYNWLKQNTSSLNVIGCVPPIEAHLYLFTERKTTALPSRPKRWCQLNISHIIYVNDTPLYGSNVGKTEIQMQAIIQDSKDQAFLELVYKNSTVSIFAVSYPSTTCSNNTQNNN